MVLIRREAILDTRECCVEHADESISSQPRNDSRLPVVQGDRRLICAITYCTRALVCCQSAVGFHEVENTWSLSVRAGSCNLLRPLSISDYRFAARIMIAS